MGLLIRSTIGWAGSELMPGPAQIGSPQTAGGAVAAPRSNKATPQSPPAKPVSGNPTGAKPACPKPVPGKPAPGNCAWYDPDNPDPMHQQGITYDKANETVNLLLKYTDDKMLTLRDWSSDTSDEKQQQQALEAMGDFCIRKPDESAKDCFKRFERYTLLNMQRMRLAIGSNESSAAALMSRQVDMDTKATRGQDVPITEVLPPGGGTPTFRKPTVVYMPSYDDLKALSLEKAKSAPNLQQLQASITNEFAEWLGSERGYSAPPDPRDFPKFKRILRDPDNPSAGYFSVVVKGPDGKALVDEKAFKAAVAAYTYGRPGKEHVLQQDAHRLLRNKLGKARILPPRLNPKTGVLDAGVGTLERDSFGRARHELVDVSNSSTSAPLPAPPKPGMRVPSSKVDKGRATNADSLISNRHRTGKPPVLDGNEMIKQPTGTEKNQNSTYTVRLPLQDVQRTIVKDMVESIPTTEIQPAVELPPGEPQ